MSSRLQELAKIRREWVEINRKNRFETGIKRLLTDLYPDNAHFVYELLQNAEDAHAQEVRFILYEDRIEFEHDGDRLFSIDDVEAITSIGFSTKRDDTTNIGKFGVGFKAVFAYTDTPLIESGEFHFRIRDMVVPEPDHQTSVISRKRQTRFTLPFDNPNKPSDRARSEIEKLLKALNGATLLFLTYIRKIEYLLPDLSLGYIERVDLGDSRCEIRVQQPGELIESPTWFLRFDKDVEVKDDEGLNDGHKLKNCRIALAFSLSRAEPRIGGKKKNNDGGVQEQAEWTFVPMEPGRVCIFFPADKETSNLRFHLHAPFASTVARDSVRNCVGNGVLRDHLADLLAESMVTIRDQGLLTVQALALFPNDKDNLTEFYKPIMDRLVREFKEQDLVPMKRGGHAAASGIFRGQRALSDLIDDDDLIVLLGDGYSAPIWVANPPQRNQREDNFLSLLKIQEWSDDDLLSALRFMDDTARADWMSSKDYGWHQRFYAFLFSHASKLNDIEIIRTSNKYYRRGRECYFPTEEVEHDEEFPRVAKQVYCLGEEVNKRAHDFLVAIGVRVVDEKVEIEALLKAQYSHQSEHPIRKVHYNHLKHFIHFLAENPTQSNLFQEAYIFMVDRGDDIIWVKPTDIYLDRPFLNTGLQTYYNEVGKETEKRPLSAIYKRSGIKTETIGEFARCLRAKIILDRHDLSKVASKIANIKKESQLNISQLLWKSFVVLGKVDYYILQDSECYYKGWGHYGKKYSHSNLCLKLRQSEWVPQLEGEKFEFLKPCDAVAGKLPEGFEYQTGWQWLRDLEFGKSVDERKEAQRRERERQTAEYKRKDEFAKALGFESPEEAEEIAQLKNEDPYGFNKWRESRKGKPSFPTRSLVNPERRQEHLDEQMSSASDKIYQKRERSVRTSNGSIDPSTYLRENYTDNNLMVCQICKEEMPFRKRNGEHYFEKKEVLSRDFLTKEHEAQYLALCPLCAAKYQEYVRNDDDVMAQLKEVIVGAEGYEVPVLLGDEKTSVRFVETHINDLKIIIQKAHE